MLKTLLLFYKLRVDVVTDSMPQMLSKNLKLYLTKKIPWKASWLQHGVFCQRGMWLAFCKALIMINLASYAVHKIRDKISVLLLKRMTFYVMWHTHRSAHKRKRKSTVVISLLLQKTCEVSLCIYMRYSWAQMKYTTQDNQRYCV